MIGIGLGVLAIWMGAGAFTSRGLSLTNEKKLTGKWAKGIGAGCILLGAAFVADGGLALVQTGSLLGSAVVRMAYPDAFQRDPPRPIDQPKQFTLNDVLAPLPKDWYVIDDPVAGFSAQMPVRPNEEIVSGESDWGPLEFRVWTITRGDAALTISVETYKKPIPPPEAAIESLFKLLKSDYGNEVLSEEPIELAGVTGRQMVLNAPDGITVYVRACVVENRRYRLVAAVPRSLQTPEIVTKFFDSFALAKDKPQPAPEPAASADEPADPESHDKPPTEPAVP